MSEQPKNQGPRGRTPLAEPVERVMIALPASLRDQMDAFGRRRGYPSRSAVIREAFRRLAADEDREA